MGGDSDRLRNISGVLETMMDPDDYKIVAMHYVIHDHPRDYPDHFVVRITFVMEDGLIVVTPYYGLFRCLEEARAAIPEGCVCFVRHPNDSPSIVEVWMP